MSNENAPLLKWTIVNALGLGVGFVVILQTGMLIELGFDWKMHWVWIENPPAQNVTKYLSVLLSMLAGGVFLGLIQALFLHSRFIPSLQWIFATVVGFGTVAAIIDWPLIALGLLGNMPGPVEPLIITVGGASSAGFFQFLILRRMGASARKWLALWIVGLVAGVVPTALLMISLETFGLSPSWPLEVFISGAVIAGVAALTSGMAFFAALRSLEVLEQQ